MKAQGLILWLLAGTGVILMYSAYANVTPTSLIAKSVGAADSTTPLVTMPNSVASKAQDTKTAKDLFGIAPNGTSPAPSKVPGGTTPNYWGLTTDTAGYIGRDPEGVAFQYSADGYQMYQLPTAYQNNSNTFIPAAGTLDV